MDSAVISPTPDSNQSTTPESHTNDVTPPFHSTKNICSPRKHPAGVNFQHQLIKPNEDLQRYLNFQLMTPKLNRIHHLLWLAGLPRAARPLHRQKLMKRTVILTESPDEHLVWSPGQILIKPVPEYLLDRKFWVRNICPNRELYAAACGLLLSYAWLVAGLIDFQIAKDEHILPSDVKWKAWTKLIQEVLEWKDKNYDNDNSRSSSLPAQNNRSLQPQPAIINKRYEFGELRLSRLNSLYRLTPSIFSIRNLVLGFMPGSAWYQEFFERNFSWILAVLVYLSVLLSAMQAGLATDTLQGNRRFQKICTVFALASIFFAYLVLNFPNEMSLDSPLKRVVQSVTDNIHDKDSDGHRGKRPKFDKPLGTSGSSSVPDTDTSPGSLVSDHHVQDALQLEDDQLCGESSPPPYSEAICSPAPQALSPEHLPPDPVQDSLQQCHNNLVQDLQGTQGENADHLRDIYVQIKPAQDLHSLSGDQSFGIPNTFATLALSIQWNRGDFLSKTGTPIATLNCETHRQLSSIRVDEDPIWLGVMPMDELQQRIRVVKKRSSLSSSLSPFSTSSSADFSSSMETCKMNIFVFGPLVIEDVLARELGWHRLYLDHPDPMPDQVKYYNPQWFYTEGTPFYERLVSPPIPGTADQHQHDMDNSDEPGADKSEDDEDDDADAQAVPDGSSNLHNEAYIDSRIRTELKR
ncbi:hypothetical protein AAWM_08947 [Aspergillus awamori]|uniref:Uncharacterized protein n=1 Tax=Aspergillus awamori TaxID=105351 RepID=A0A401L3I2_ASPAW|nr:hypothetical protein AAWM_08947 [Aspergillus awamori]